VRAGSTTPATAPSDRTRANAGADLPPAAAARTRWLVSSLAAVAALAALVRLPGLGSTGLWIDEVIEVNAARDYDGLGIVHHLMVGNDPASPLAYLFMDLWLPVAGRSEVLLRLPFALFGVMTCVLWPVLLRPWLGDRLALAGGVLMALSPFEAWYAREARLYEPLLMLTVLALLCLDRAVRRSSTAWLAGWVLSTAACFYTHPFGMLVPGSAALLALATRRSPRILVAGVAALALCAPWMSVNLSRAGSPIGTPRDWGAADVLYGVFSFGAGHTLGPGFEELHFARHLGVLRPDAPVIAAVALVFGACLVAGAWAARSQPAARLALYLFLAPLGLGIVAALCLRSLPFHPRYVSGCIFGFHGVVLCGVASLPRAARAGLFAAVVALSLASVYNLLFEARYRREDARGAAAIMAATPQAPVVSLEAFEIPLAYYLAPGRLHATDPRRKGDIEAAVAAARRTGGLLWLAWAREWVEDPTGSVRTRLDSELTLRAYHRLPGVELFLFEVPPES
jgi:uncharacterized membrane protein